MGRKTNMIHVKSNKHLHQPEDSMFFLVHPRMIPLVHDVGNEQEKTRPFSLTWAKVYLMPGWHSLAVEPKAPNTRLLGPFGA